MTEQDVYKLEIKYSETRIQHTCVSWFRNTFPNVAGLLFAIPNGGVRSPRDGAMRKYEGALSGVSDLILLYPSHGKAALCIEMKTPKQKGKSAGAQSSNQKEWQKLVESKGSVYVVCHGLIEFITAVCLYLHIDRVRYIDDALIQYPKYLD